MAMAVTVAEKRKRRTLSEDELFAAYGCAQNTENGGQPHGAVDNSPVPSASRGVPTHDLRSSTEEEAPPIIRVPSQPNTGGAL